MAAKNKPDTAAIVQTQLPQAVFGLETAKAAEMLATVVAKYGPSVGKAIYEAWNGKEVVFVEIQASDFADGKFQVVLGFHNLIAHGVYLNRFWAKSPEQMKLRVTILKDRPGVSFDTFKGRPPAQSFDTQILLANGGNLTNVWLEIPSISVPKDVDFVEVGFEIARLDDPASQELAIKVRLRGRP